MKVGLQKQVKAHTSVQPDCGWGCGLMLFLNTYFCKLGKYRKEQNHHSRSVWKYRQVLFVGLCPPNTFFHDSWLLELEFWSQWDHWRLVITVPWALQQTSISLTWKFTECMRSTFTDKVLRAQLKNLLLGFYRGWLVIIPLSQGLLEPQAQLSAFLLHPVYKYFLWNPHFSDLSDFWGVH